MGPALPLCRRRGGGLPSNLRNNQASFKIREGPGPIPGGVESPPVKGLCQKKLKMENSFSGQRTQEGSGPSAMLDEGSQPPSLDVGLGRGKKLQLGLRLQVRISRGHRRDRICRDPLSQFKLKKNHGGNISGNILGKVAGGTGHLYIKKRLPLPREISRQEKPPIFVLSASYDRWVAVVGLDKQETVLTPTEETDIWWISQRYCQRT